MEGGANRVVILGAGYGGLRVALDLARAYYPEAKRPDIVLVDRYPYHQSIVQLHEVAAGSLDPSYATVPLDWLLKGLPVRFVQAEVLAIIPAARQVQLSSGALTYDYLVIALGSESDYFGIPGLAENSLGLKSVEEATRIRAHIRRMFELAVKEADQQQRRQMLTVIVGGGGFTGTELAGELADTLPVLADRLRISRDAYRLLVLEGKESLLPGAASEISSYASASLKQRGVELWLGRPLVRVEDGKVTLASGEVLKTRTLIWTGGVRATQLVAAAGLPVGIKGRALVNPYLQSVAYPDVYVVGDAALTVDPNTGRPMAPSAQLAIMHAKVAAQNIRASIVGARLVPFRGAPIAEIISLGRHDAIAEIGPVIVTGRPARVLKDLARVRYFLSIGGLPLALRMAPLPWRYRPWSEVPQLEAEELRRAA